MEPSDIDDPSDVIESLRAQMARQEARIAALEESLAAARQQAREQRRQIEAVAARLVDAPRGQERPHSAAAADPDGVQTSLVAPAAVDSALAGGPPSATRVANLGPLRGLTPEGAPDDRPRVKLPQIQAPATQLANVIQFAAEGSESEEPLRQRASSPRSYAARAPRDLRPIAAFALVVIVLGFSTGVVFWYLTAPAAARHTRYQLHLAQATGQNPPGAAASGHGAAASAARGANVATRPGLMRDASSAAGPSLRPDANSAGASLPPSASQLAAASSGTPNDMAPAHPAAADPQHARLNGQLLTAAALGNTAAARAALEAGADPNFRNARGSTVLMTAARFGNESVARELIAHGADVNASNRYGWTALMLAAKYDHPLTAARLLQSGADPNATNSNGANAERIAQTSGSRQAESVLRK